MKRRHLVIVRPPPPPLAPGRVISMRRSALTRSGSAAPKGSSRTAPPDARLTFSWRHPALAADGELGGSSGGGGEPSSDSRSSTVPSPPAATCLSRSASASVSQPQCVSVSQFQPQCLSGIVSQCLSVPPFFLSMEPGDSQALSGSYRASAQRW